MEPLRRAERVRSALMGDAFLFHGVDAAATATSSSPRLRGHPPRRAIGHRCDWQVAHPPGQPAHWPNRGRVGSMRALGTWSTQERTSTSRSVSGKARMWRFTP